MTIAPLALLVPVLLVESGDESRHGPVRVAAQRERAYRALDLARKSIGIDAIAFERDADRVPVASNGWHWSVSHARDCGAAVLARAPVGIDVEQVADRDPALVHYVLNDAEIRALGGDDTARFFRAWTAKEAVLKMRRVGLAELSLCRVIAVLDDERTLMEHRGLRTVVAHAIRGPHVAAVATEGDATPNVTWTWSA